MLPAALVLFTASPSPAQQTNSPPTTSQPSMSQPSGPHDMTSQPSTSQQSAPQAGAYQTSPGQETAMTIDCPASAVQQKWPGGEPVGKLRVGSGLSAMPATAPPQRVEGQIKSIGSTRTNRTVEIGDLKLEVEPNSIVLVNCKPGTVADLKEGEQVKASYQEKEPNRNMALVIEAQPSR
jgi:hypothetical protein